MFFGGDMMAETQATLWPGWTTLREIGKGSYGAVYEIQRELLGRTESAAVKVISIPHDPGEIQEYYNSGYSKEDITTTLREQLSDIINEYSIMAQMKGHSNIVCCDDIRFTEHSDGLGWDVFIKMELLTPLQSQPLPNAENVARLGADICRALMLCEQKKIVHRDVKPHNIFVSDTGSYKLGDFGIAKTLSRTTAGTKIGTYNFMAPEVYNNKPYNQTVDIYSLGIVMYTLLNERRLPFLPLPPAVPMAANIEAARFRRFRGDTLPAPENGSPALKQIVQKACAFQPEKRYQSAQDMLRDLEKILSAPVLDGSGLLRDEPVRKNNPSSTVMPPHGTSATVAAYDPPQQRKLSQKNRKQHHLLILIPVILSAAAIIFLLARYSTSFPEKEANQQLALPEITLPSSEPIPSVTEPDFPLPTSQTVEKTNLFMPVLDSLGPEDLYNTDHMEPLEEEHSNTYFWGQTQYRRKDIYKIVFRDTLESIGPDSWDVSDAQDGTILAWVENNVLYVAADGKITLGKNACGLFSCFTNAVEIQLNDCLDTSLCQDMSDFFLGCRSLEQLDLSGLDTSHAEKMSDMFGSLNLQYLDVSGLDTSSAISIANMFANCVHLKKIDLSGFDTGKVQDMCSLFANCFELGTVELGDFNTSSVLTMNGVFYRCRNLQRLDLTVFDTKKVEDMSWMFAGSCPTYLDISSFDSSSVTNFEGMFKNAQISEIRINDDSIRSAFRNR